MRYLFVLLAVAGCGTTEYRIERQPWATQSFEQVEAQCKFETSTTFAGTMQECVASKGWKPVPVK